MIGRPPHGGRGLKSFQIWVRSLLPPCRPPHGGRGLKSLCSYEAKIGTGRPPHGGRGLKCPLYYKYFDSWEVALPTEGVD